MEKKETFKITAKEKKEVRCNIWCYYKKESRIKKKKKKVLIKLVLVNPNLYSVPIEEENNNTVV